ncbi:MAG: alcohol dehydrogenase GroES protein [Actinomycetia bacterium]|nr:alcohol dehydrogenase GroES protein [Actinomycetes bacterium]
MFAVAVNEYGGDPAVVELPKPKPGVRQILIKVRAAGTNPMDWQIANGAFKGLMPATFPLVLGADVAGVVEAVGEGTTKFAPGDEVFGQLVVAPIGSTGTYAEYVAVTEEAPLAKEPDALDPMAAAALPTAGVTALQIVASLEPLTGKTALIVGAGGGVGSFVTQYAANDGARVIADARGSAADRMRSYGAAETIDYTAVSAADAVERAHPDGIDVLIDVASDADGFAALASLVRSGGTALTTRYIADADALNARGVTGVNFRVQMSSEVLEQLASDVVDGRIVVPPITKIELDDVPFAMNTGDTHPDGKTVITL